VSDPSEWGTMAFAAEPTADEVSQVQVKIMAVAFIPH
jgi:hypothetical protein